MKRKYVLFKRSGSKVWYAYRWEGNRKVARSTGETSKARAEARLEEIFSEPSKSLTLTDFSADFFIWDRCQWIAHQLQRGRRIGKAVAAQRRAHLVNYLLPRWGTTPMVSITVGAFENWLDSLPLSNQSRNHVIHTTRIVLKEAVRQEAIPRDALAGLQLYGVTPAPRDILALGELRQLFNPDAKVWPDIRQASLFAVLASTGIRSGEARGLTWEQVRNQPAAHLLINAAVNASGERSTTKSGRERVTLLPARVGEMLTEWHGISPYPAPADLVWYGRAGRTAISKRTISIWFTAGLQRAGVRAEGRTLTVHGLRTGYNTRLRGLLDPALLRTLLGHSSERMTQTYDHPDAGELLKRVLPAAGAIEETWG